MTERPIRVLLVEDDEDDFVVTRALLAEVSSPRFELTWSRTLDGGLARLGRDALDIVLLDLSLPDSQGWDTFQRVRKTVPRLPVILLTGLNDETMGVRAVQKGAQDYLVKDQIDRPQLVRAIRYAIERKEGEEQLRRYQNELEELVTQRTAKLITANKQLEREIVERKEAEAEAHETRQYLETVIMTSHDGIVVVDDDGHFEFANQASFRIFGWPPEEFIGAHFLKVVPPDSRVFMQERWDEARRGEGKPYELDIVQKNGERRSVLVSQRPMNIAMDRKYCMAVTDITERKQAERELRKAFSRLEAYDRARSEFVSNVSHELKSPLASITYAVDNMLKGVVGSFTERGEAYLRMILAQSRRLTTTVADILDMTRLDGKALSLHEAAFPLAGLVERTVEGLHVQAQMKHQRLCLDIDDAHVFVRCDAEKIERVVVNVVGNAMKYGPEGGTIDVSVSRDPAERDLMRVRVVDDGPGIAPEHIAHVTERYYRVGDHISGTGLGLALAKEILEMHGGSIELSSPPEGLARGTEVRIRLPVASPPLVLVVDDERGSYDEIVHYLEQRGYNVVHCASGQAALEHLENGRPELLIVSLAVSGMPGIELIAHAKASEAWRRIPLIAVAAGPLSRSEKALLQGYGIPSLLKPWVPGALADCLDIATGRRHYPA